MKKIVRSMAMVALMFTTASGFAKEPSYNVTPSEGRSIHFEIESSSGQKTLHILDSEEKIIFSDLINESSTYTKKFDLSKLPQGTYYLKIEDALNVTIYEVFINGTELVLGEASVNAKPVFRSVDGKLYVNFLNLDKELVTIKIVDDLDRIVFHETIQDEVLIEKVFNFQEAFENTYRVVVKAKDEVFYKNVAVK